MRIKSLTLENFRGFDGFSIDFAPGVTLIVAMNGIGKTSIIEGLASACGGFKRAIIDRRSKPLLDGLTEEADHRREWLPEQRAFQTARHFAIDVAAQWDSADVAWRLKSYSPEAENPRKSYPSLEWIKGDKALGEQLQQTARDADKALPIIMGLRAKRLSRGEKTLLPRFGERLESARDRLSLWSSEYYFDKDWYLLRNRWATFEEQSKFDSPRAQAICATIAAALQRSLGLKEPHKFSPEEADFVLHLRDEGPRPVGLMSDGWRAYVTLVAGLAMHCAEVNPLQVDAAAITPGVLLIDELEQHLHPELQLEILDGLRRAFPRLQIVATTHSPLILTDAREGQDDSIVRLDRGESGAVRKTLLAAPTGKNVLQVLTGAWFGLLSTYDDKTLQMLADHRRLLKEGPDKREEARAKAADIRQRLDDNYAKTSMEEFVLSVVAELERDPQIEALSYEQMVALRERVLRHIKRELA